ncbi:hypothetical protein R1sor_024145 [Riccia sorocarpa]|uniref:DCD domain-containing protein n=1 Tax=Riccia sorocarpa TaxID=122646 RepID=A0ABD3GTP0_9MARC
MLPYSCVLAQKVGGSLLWIAFEGRFPLWLIGGGRADLPEEKLVYPRPQVIISGVYRSVFFSRKQIGCEGRTKSYSVPLASPYSFWTLGGEFGGSTGDQKWVPPSIAYPFHEHGAYLDRRTNGETTESKTRTVGVEKKSGRGGQKQYTPTSAATSADKKQSQSSSLVLDQSKPGSMTGVFNGNTPFQLTSSHDKRFKSLPPAEMLPRHETLGGYIFVCNNDTMQEDLKRQLFGLPQRYRDSVRAIQPGLPLFLYNYTTHQLHGIFEAASFGGSNIDPTAWEDKKCRGESRFPAQVRIRVRRLCKPLQEEAFRPILHHYDGPKFRLQLSVPETLQLLDLFNAVGPP